MKCVIAFITLAIVMLQVYAVPVPAADANPQSTGAASTAPKRPLQALRQAILKARIARLQKRLAALSSTTAATTTAGTTTVAPTTTASTTAAKS